jgi:CheY-like chemotaxis protein
MQMAAKLMLVDDEPAFRLATRLYFEGRGYEITEAEDGVAALRKLDTEPLPDLVILDINMPRVSGIDVLRYMHGKEETRKIPIVMLTARSDAETETVSWHDGCDWYHIKSKPVQYDDLLLAIRRLLEMEKV